MPDIRRTGCDDAGVHRQGPQLHPRGATVARRRVVAARRSRSATKPRSPTSASSRRGSTARCATATARPRDSSSSGATRRCRPAALGSADDNIAVFDPDTRPRVPARRVRRCRAPAERRRRGRRDRQHRAGRHLRGLLPQRGGRTSRRSATASTGRATSRTATPTAGSSSPGVRTSGCASTARTSPPRRSSGSCCAHPAVRSAAVYAVPDDPVGDRVMVAVEVDDVRRVRRRRVRRLRAPRSPTSDRSGSRASCGSTAELPKLASMKIDKSSLRREGWNVPGISWRPKRGEPMQPMTPSDVDALAAPAAVNGWAAAPASAEEPT